MDPRDSIPEALSEYLDGECSPEECAEMEARLRREPALREALEELRSVASEIRALPRLPAPDSVLNAVRRELDAAPPLAPRADLRTAPAPSPSRKWWGAGLLSAAAMLAVGALLFAVFGTQVKHSQVTYSPQGASAAKDTALPAEPSLSARPPGSAGQAPAANGVVAPKTLREELPAANRSEGAAPPPSARGRDEWGASRPAEAPAAEEAAQDSAGLARPIQAPAGDASPEKRRAASPKEAEGRPYSRDKLGEVGQLDKAGKLDNVARADDAAGKKAKEVGAKSDRQDDAGQAKERLLKAVAVPERAAAPAAPEAKAAGGEKPRDGQSAPGEGRFGSAGQEHAKGQAPADGRNAYGVGGQQSDRTAPGAPGPAPTPKRLPDGPGGRQVLRDDEGKGGAGPEAGVGGAGGALAQGGERGLEERKRARATGLPGDPAAAAEPAPAKPGVLAPAEPVARPPRKDRVLEGELAGRAPAVTIRTRLQGEVLAAVKVLAERHGGRISTEVADGRPGGVARDAEPAAAVVAKAEQSAARSKVLEPGVPSRSEAEEGTAGRKGDAPGATGAPGADAPGAAGAARSGRAAEELQRAGRAMRVVVRCPNASRAEVLRALAELGRREGLRRLGERKEEALPVQEREEVAQKQPQAPPAKQGEREGRESAVAPRVQAPATEKAATGVGEGGGSPKGGGGVDGPAAAASSQGAGRELDQAEEKKDKLSSAAGLQAEVGWAEILVEIMEE